MLDIRYGFWDAWPGGGIPPFSMTLADSAAFSAGVSDSADSAVLSTAAPSIELDTQ